MAMFAESLKPGNITPKSGIYTPSKGGAQASRATPLWR